MDQYMNLYVVKDNDTSLFEFPFPCQKDKIAIKAVKDYINKHSDLFEKDDLTLYRFGSYNCNTGKFNVNDPLIEVPISWSDNNG